MTGIYVIESVRAADGDVHERELRRKGHRVALTAPRVGYPLIAVYVDDANKHLATSRVREFSEVDGVLTVKTKNSIYTFRKEAADGEA